MNFLSQQEQWGEKGEAQEPKPNERRLGGMGTLEAVQKMTATRQAQEDARWKAKAWLPTAVEMYQTGKGIKAIAKDTGASSGAVRNGLIWSGVYKGNKAEDMTERRKAAQVMDKLDTVAFNPERLIIAGYREDAQSIKRMDEQMHWGNHPVRVREINLVNSRKQAAKQWERHKSDPSLLAKRYAAARDWRGRNPDKLREIYRKWIKSDSGKASMKAFRSKPEVKLVRNLRHRLKDFIQSKGVQVKALIGCSPIFLRNHIESQFKNGMSWANYGEWHVDHILPCASFDLTREDEQAKCFHYTNLQPLWGCDNMRKSDTMPNGTRARDLASLYRKRGRVVIADMEDGDTPVGTPLT